MSIKEVLPIDCMLHIFSFLDSRALAKRVNLVCKQWRDLSNHDSLWKQLCLKDFLTETNHDGNSWKDYYHMHECPQEQVRRVSARVYLEHLENLESDPAFLDPAYGVKC